MRGIIQTLSGVWGLLTGLFITGRFFFSRKKTVYYPRQVIEADRIMDFRGPIELVGSDTDPAVPRCISCMMCMQNCPSQCITIERQKPPKLTEEEQKAMAEAEARGEKPKKPTAPKNPARWDYDYSRCSLCGTCVEVCPVKSLAFSHDIYLAGTSRDDFNRDLLARLARLAGKNKKPEPEQNLPEPPEEES